MDTSYEAHYYAIFLELSIISTLSGQNILLRTLFSDTLSLCSSRNFKEQFLRFRQQVRSQKFLD